MTEMVHCYGFLAVFVTALTLRHAHRDHEFQREMHDLTEQIERLAMMVLLILFGGALASGLLAPLRWVDVGVAAAVLLIVRPAAGLLSLIGSRTTCGERLTLAFFGIRGVGSIYYLAYALNAAPFAQGDRLWAIIGLIVLLSILLHGLTVAVPANTQVARPVASMASGTANQSAERTRSTVRSMPSVGVTTITSTLPTGRTPNASSSRSRAGMAAERPSSSSSTSAS